MTILSQKTIDRIIEELDKKIIDLAKGAAESLEFQNSYEEIRDFLASQYEIRLYNLLAVKNIDINHLESGIKNKIIQRKHKLLEEISKMFQH